MPDSSSLSSWESAAGGSFHDPVPGGPSYQQHDSTVWHDPSLGVQWPSHHRGTSGTPTKTLKHVIGGNMGSNSSRTAARAPSRRRHHMNGHAVPPKPKPTTQPPLRQPDRVTLTPLPPRVDAAIAPKPESQPVPAFIAQYGVLLSVIASVIGLLIIVAVVFGIAYQYRRSRNRNRKRGGEKNLVPLNLTTDQSGPVSSNGHRLVKMESGEHMYEEVHLSNEVEDMEPRSPIIAAAMSGNPARYDLLKPAHENKAFFSAEEKDHVNESKAANEYASSPVGPVYFALAEPVTSSPSPDLGETTTKQPSIDHSLNHGSRKAAAPQPASRTKSEGGCSRDPRGQDGNPHHPKLTRQRSVTVPYHKPVVGYDRHYDHNDSTQANSHRASTLHRSYGSNVSPTYQVVDACPYAAPPLAVLNRRRRAASCNDGAADCQVQVEVEVYDKLTRGVSEGASPSSSSPSTSTSSTGVSDGTPASKTAVDGDAFYFSLEEAVERAPSTPTPKPKVKSRSKQSEAHGGDRNSSQYGHLEGVSSSTPQLKSISKQNGDHDSENRLSGPYDHLKSKPNSAPKAKSQSKQGGRPRSEDRQSGPYDHLEVVPTPMPKSKSWSNQKECLDDGVRQSRVYDHLGALGPLTSIPNKSRSLNNGARRPSGPYGHLEVMPSVAADKDH